jgi:hypothetical protein
MNGKLRALKELWYEFGFSYAKSDLYSLAPLKSNSTFQISIFLLSRNVKICKVQVIREAHGAKIHF